MRSKLSLVPRDPFLFEGSLRANLDPLEEHSDDALWHALECAQMKAAVLNLEGKLDGMVSVAGLNFSAGERQLLSLARAFLRQSKVIVLDDCFSSADPHTLALVRSTLHQHFSSATLISIAHDLSSVPLSDKVLMLQKGAIVDFDLPARLLSATGSPFTQLVHEYGRRVFWQLSASSLASARAKGIVMPEFDRKKSKDPKPPKPPKEIKRQRKGPNASGAGSSSKAPGED